MTEKHTYSSLFIDELICYLMGPNRARIEPIQFGKLTVSIQEGRLFSVSIQEDQKRGKEIPISDLSSAEKDELDR